MHNNETWWTKRSWKFLLVKSWLSQRVFYSFKILLSEAFRHSILQPPSHLWFITIIKRLVILQTWDAHSRVPVNEAKYVSNESCTVWISALLCSAYYSFLSNIHYEEDSYSAQMEKNICDKVKKSCQNLWPTLKELEWTQKSNQESVIVENATQFQCMDAIH